MRSQKLILSAAAGFCALLLAGTPAAHAADAAFQDTTGHWAETSIQRMSGYQIVNGYQGQFRPDNSITRGEMAVILDQVMNYQRKAYNRFTDLGEAFYTDAILRANRAGIMSGADGMVRPNDPISREEAVVMMAAAFDVNGGTSAISTTDADRISSWAADSVSAFMEKGYVNSTGAFRPQSSITRAEAVTILNHLLAGYYPSAGSYSDSASGTVVINTQNVTLKNSVIDGDLILTEGVLDGDVTLENVTVKGRTLIRGGGAHSIHVTGTSVLGEVLMERDGAAVRLAVEDKAQVGDVIVGKKAAQAIVSGTVDNVSVAGPGELTVKNGQVKNISVASPNVTVTLTGKSSVNTIVIAQSAENAQISAEENTSIGSAQIDAPGVQVSGKGTVHKVKANADRISVDTQGTKVTAASGTTGVTAGGQPVTAGQSVSTGSGSNSSSESRPSKPSQLDIYHVESKENGWVRVTLNRASDQPLRKEQFSIICTGGGKDMTILNVRTSDNRVYDLTTAYYNDNTYQLGLMLDDGRLVTYNFVSKYDCPAITSTMATRTAANTAKFSYVSDIAGTFYWTVQPSEQSVLRAAPQEPTAEELMQTGKQQPMELYSNTIQISGLAENTPYTMFYVAKGTDEKVTSVKQVQIAAEPAEAPPESHIKIDQIRAYNNPSPSLTHEHVYFDIRLSEPSPEMLASNQFHMSCPTDKDIHLGRVVSTDRQSYRLYLQPGYMIKDNNHFTCTISFADGTQTAETFFVDLTGPNLTATTITRLPQSKAKVQFTASEPGKIYYKVLTGDEFGYGSSGAKDPNLVIKDGQTRDIVAGTQFFETDFSSKPAQTGLYFCYVAEDKLGNRTTFWYEPIPDQETTPTPTPPAPDSNKYKIVSFTGQKDIDHGPMSQHLLTITMNENTTGDMLFSGNDITITGDSTILAGQKELNVSYNSSHPTVHEVIVFGKTLTPGDYTFTAKIPTDSGTETVTQSFTVGSDPDLTVTPK